MTSTAAQLRDHMFPWDKAQETGDARPGKRFVTQGSNRSSGVGAVLKPATRAPLPAPPAPPPSAPAPPAPAAAPAASGAPLDECRWGIIGVGDVCEVKSGPAFQKCNGSKLVAVMRRTGALAKDFAERHGVQKWYDDVDALLGDDDINCVYIATPPGSHLEIAVKVAEAGKPAYVEKPLARNAPETRQIIDAFASRGVPLFAAYYRRGQPKFVRAREIVQGGELGTVTSLSYTMTRPPFVLGGDVGGGGEAARLPWRFRAEHSGGGLIMDVGCHTLDIIDFIVGPLRDVGGAASSTGVTPYAVEDAVSVSATFGTGATASLSWTFAGPPGSGEDLITVRGTRGEMKLSTFGKDDPVVLSKDATAADAGGAGGSGGGGGAATVAGAGDWISGKAGGDALRTQELFFDAPEHAHQPLVQLVVDDLRGVGTCPSKGDNALRCAETLDAVLGAFYGGRDDQFWTRQASWPGARSKQLQ